MGKEIPYSVRVHTRLRIGLEVVYIAFVWQQPCHRFGSFGALAAVGACQSGARPPPRTTTATALPYEGLGGPLVPERGRWGVADAIESLSGRPLPFGLVPTRPPFRVSCPFFLGPRLPVCPATLWLAVLGALCLQGALCGPARHGH